mgnify:CR=1 FL=1
MINKHYYLPRIEGPITLYSVIASWTSSEWMSFAITIVSDFPPSNTTCSLDNNVSTVHILVASFETTKFLPLHHGTNLCVRKNCYIKTAKSTNLTHRWIPSKTILCKKLLLPWQKGLDILSYSQKMMAKGHKLDLCNNCIYRK